MTMPDERRRAVEYAREFLLDLLDPKKTPRVPSAVRKRASDVLKHYPGEFYMEEAHRALPEMFGSLYEKNDKTD